MADSGHSNPREGEEAQRTIWDRFDSRLYLLKLKPVTKQRNEQIEKEIRGIPSKVPPGIPGLEHYKPVRPDFIQEQLRVEIAYLPQVPEEIYQTACEVWEIQGEEKTPEFLWAIFHNRIVPGIRGSEHRIWSECRRYAAARGETEAELDAEKRQLEVAVAKLLEEWRVKIETEARELAHKKAREKREKEALMERGSSVTAEGSSTEEDAAWESLQPIVRQKFGIALEDWVAKRERDWREVSKKYVKFEPSVPWPPRTIQESLDFGLKQMGDFCETLWTICEETRNELGIEKTPAFPKAVFNKLIAPRIEFEKKTRANGIRQLARRCDVEPKPWLDGLDSGMDNLKARWRKKAGIEAETLERRRSLAAAISPVTPVERQALEAASSGKADRKPQPKGFSGLSQKRQDLSHYFDKANLTDRQRDCASLKWEYGLSDRKIAGRLDIAHSVVQEHLKAAKTRMDRTTIRPRNKTRISPKGLDEDC